MNTIRLHAGPVMIDALLDATSAQVPEIVREMRFRFEDGVSEPVSVSNQEQARKVHMARLGQMIDSGEIVPRSPLTLAPWIDFEPQHESMCVVTWAEAQTFCRMLALDLQPALEQSPEEKDAALLALFREMGGVVKDGQLTGKRGALAALARGDGRTRQTLTEILIRAAKNESTAGAFGHITKRLLQ